MSIRLLSIISIWCLGEVAVVGNAAGFVVAFGAAEEEDTVRHGGQMRSRSSDWNWKEETVFENEVACGLC